MKKILITFLFLILAYGQTYPESYRVNASSLPFAGDHYTGFITVNTTTGSKLYYELFGYNNGSLNSSKPLIIWLQGGPGCSSLFGEFVEIGPYFINSNEEETEFYTTINPNTWNQQANLLFIDQPIGTGFSVVENNEFINTTLQAAAHFQNFLIRFYQVYPTLLNSPLHLFGESYAGHWLPAFAYTILQNSSNSYIPLTSVGLGDGWVNPFIQTPVYSTYGYAVGIMDQRNRDMIRKIEYKSITDILRGELVEASNESNDILEILEEITDGVSDYDYRVYGGVPSEFEFWLNTTSVQNIFGIPPTDYESCSGSVSYNFLADNSMDYSYTLEYVLTRIPVLLYVGQDDDNVNYEGILNYINMLKWEGTSEFKLATRYIWKNQGQVVGNVKSYENLTFLTVYKAGHMVPQYQPENALLMVKLWLHGRPFA